MKKINYWAIIVFYLIAILCRYLTNKTEIFEEIGNEYLKSILTGIGPAIGAFVAFSVFKKPSNEFERKLQEIIISILDLLGSTNSINFLCSLFSKRNFSLANRINNLDLWTF